MADKALYNLLLDIRANFANLQKDLGSATAMLEKGGKTMHKIMEGVAQGIGQAFGQNLIRNIENVSGALTRLAERGEVVGSIAETFEKIGGSAAEIDKAKKAVLGTVSAFDLMKVANDGIIRGLPDMNKNFSLLADYANRFANSSGRDTLEVLEGLTKAISTGSNKALREFGIQVSEGGTKAQKMAEAITQLSANMNMFSAETDSVANAHAAFNVAIQDALNWIGIGINESETLTEAYRGMADAINSIDWKHVGQDIASIVPSLKEVIGAVQYTIGLFNDFKRGLNAIMGGASEQLGLKAANVQDQIAALKKQISIADSPDYKNRGFDSPVASWVDKQLGMNVLGPLPDKGALESQLAERQKELDDIYATIGRINKEAEKSPVFGPDVSRDWRWDAKGGKWMERSEDSRNTPTTHFGGGGGAGSASKEAEKARKEQEKLAKEKQEQVAALHEAEYKSQRRNQEAISEYQKQEIQNWGSLFQTVFSGEVLGLSDKTATLAADFASQIASGLMFELDGGQTGALSLGQKIGKGLADAFEGIFGSSSPFAGSGMTAANANAQGIQGPAMSNGMFGQAVGAVSSFFGSNYTTSEAHAAGIQGPGMENGQFGSATTATASAVSDYAAYAQTALGVLEVMKKDYGPGKQAQGQQIKDGIHVVGMAVANAWTFGLASVVEGLVGRENMEKLSIGVKIVDALFSENAETTARKGFDRWIEGVLEDKPVSFFNKDGMPQRFSGNFETQKYTETFTNKPGWAEGFSKTKGFPVFNALGEAFRDMLGIAEDIGGQIGYILSEELGGNINNARRLVKQLGMSFEEIEKRLVDVGLKGEKTWLEVETQIQGVAEAFKPGLVEVGAFGMAFQNVINSGAKGFEAVQSIRDLFVEASEAGIKNFDQLRQQLLKTFDPATVDAFFQALNQRGVVDIKAGADLADRQAGGVIADMQALGVKFNDVGNQVTGALGSAEGSVREAKESIDRLTSTIQNGKGVVSYEEDLATDEPLTESARGNIFYGPRKSLMGEVGPEAILPLTRRNGRLGVAVYGDGLGGGGGGGVSLHVDARGASAGVSQEIRMAMRETERRAMRGILRSVERDRRRTT